MADTVGPTLFLPSPSLRMLKDIGPSREIPSGIKICILICKNTGLHTELKSIATFPSEDCVPAC